MPEHAQQSAVPDRGGASHHPEAPAHKWPKGGKEGKGSGATDSYDEAEGEFWEPPTFPPGEQEAHELKNYIDEVQKSLMDSIGAIRTQVSSLASTVQTACTSLGSQVESRMGTVEVRQNKTEQYTKSLEARIKQLEDTLGIMRAEKPKIETDTSFDRDPNPTIVVSRCRTLVTKEQVNVAIQEWMEAANCPSSEYAIVGEPAAKRFDIQFKGQAGLAARRTSKALMFLKRGPNDWRRFVVADMTGVQQELHIGPDKSQAQILMEITLKAIKRAFIQAFPHQWKPILRVVVHKEQPTTVEWAVENIAALGLDRAEIENAIQPAIQQQTTSTQWSLERGDASMGGSFHIQTTSDSS
ncbi:unnamed protein product, partial [Prorocentrum cordatum]